MKKIQNLFWRWEGALAAVLVIELVVFGALNPIFVSPVRLLNSTPDFVYFGILALPLALVMMTGGIDISIGSTASLAAIVCGVVYVRTGSMALGLVMGLLAGLLAGAFNGLLVVATKVQPMVITLGTQFLFAGLALGVSGISGVSSFEGISNLPKWFNQIASGELLGIPNMIWLFVLSAIGFWFLLSRTSYGRQMRLLGVNPRAADYAGLRTPWLLFVGYSLTGLVAGLVGILLTAYVGSARADIGAALLMPVLTLVVIGGVSMYGGEGTMAGVIIATFVIGIAQQGLRFQGLTENEISVALGFALIIGASLRWWSGRIAESSKNAKAYREQQPQAAASPAR